MFRNLSKIITLFLIVIFVLTGCFNKENQVDVINTDSNQPSASQGIPNVENKQDVVLDTIQNQPVEQSEIILEDLSNQDIQVLEQPENQAYLRKIERSCSKNGSNCDEAITFKQIIILEKPELCNQLEEKQDNCYKYFAFERDDLQYCNLIQDNNEMNNCSDMVNHVVALNTNNILICAKINNENNKLDCQTGVMTQQNDVSYCDSSYIQNNNLAEQCQSIIISGQAWQNNNSDLCNQVPNDEYRQACFGEM